MVDGDRRAAHREPLKLSTPKPKHTGKTAKPAVSEAAARPKRAAARARATVTKDHVIQIRTTAETKSLLVRAAEIEGKSLSDCVIETARRDAIDAILDQKVFRLDEKAFEDLLDQLDNPPPLDDGVRARLSRKPLWEE